MRARIYVNNQLVGEASVTPPTVHGKSRAIALADVVAIAFFEDHPERGYRPLVAHAAIEPMLARGLVEST